MEDGDVLDRRDGAAEDGEEDRAEWGQDVNDGILDGVQRGDEDPVVGLRSETDEEADTEETGFDWK